MADHALVRWLVSRGRPDFVIGGGLLVDRRHTHGRRGHTHGTGLAARMVESDRRSDHASVTTIGTEDKEWVWPAA